jgi:hypothetical protein
MGEGDGDREYTLEYDDGTITVSMSPIEADGATQAVAADGGTGVVSIDEGTVVVSAVTPDHLADAIGNIAELYDVTTVRERGLDAESDAVVRDAAAEYDLGIEG